MPGKGTAKPGRLAATAELIPAMSVAQWPDHQKHLPWQWERAATHKGKVDERAAYFRARQTGMGRSWLGSLSLAKLQRERLHLIV